MRRARTSSADQRAVLIVHAVAPTGGSAHVAVEDAKALVAGGYRVGFAAAGAAPPAGLAGHDIAVHRLYLVDPERHSKLVRYLIGLPLSTCLLWWLVRRHRYAVLYVQHRQSGWPSRIVSWLTGARYVFISHSELGARHRGRWATPLGADIIAVAEHIKQNIVTHYGVAERRITVIPNAVYVEPGRSREAAVEEACRRWQVEPEAAVVACVAHLVPVKSHDVLLDAWARVVRARPESRLLLAGTGPLESSLRGRCRDLRLDTSVRFLGQVDDVSAVYARADLVALASRSEGMPLSVLEAFAHGVPVVATAVPGLREIVANGQTGLLVPVGDADALANAILELLSDPPRRHRMGLAAREVVARRHLPADRGRRLCRYFDMVATA